MSTVEQAVEDLLSEQDWTGKIFSDGWVDAPETIETIEPATGEVLGAAGVANAASVAAAAKSAARASATGRRSRWPTAWRSSRRAAELLERHRAEISGWMVASPERSRRRWSTRSARPSGSSTRLRR